MEAQDEICGNLTREVLLCSTSRMLSHFLCIVSVCFSLSLSLSLSLSFSLPPSLPPSLSVSLSLSPCSRLFTLWKAGCDGWHSVTELKIKVNIWRVKNDLFWEGRFHLWHQRWPQKTEEGRKKKKPLLIPSVYFKSYWGRVFTILFDDVLVWHLPLLRACHVKNTHNYLFKATFKYGCLVCAPPLHQKSGPSRLL